MPLSVKITPMPRRPPPDLAELLGSWLRHLRAEHKSPATVALYDRGVRAYLDWCGRQQLLPNLDRGTVTAFTADVLASGREAATARAYQLAVRLFAAWLAAEGELPADPLVGLRPPKLDQKVTPVLSDDQLKALIAACQGKTFRDRRDEAIIRLMVETGIRAGEAVALEVADVDLDAGMATIVRGKGGKGRRVAFGPQTARAVDRYLRLRRAHRLAGETRLWLADNGRSFRYDGLRKALVGRAELAGIKNFHPHVLRHTAAHRWLAAGGSEGGLMAVAGWANRAMIERYAAGTRSERAAEEARRLGLGDL
jgi:site-specific recombinase XerD